MKAEIVYVCKVKRGNSGHSLTAEYYQLCNEQETTTPWMGSKTSTLLDRHPR